MRVAQAIERAEEIRARVAGMTFSYGHDPLGPVSVSIGVAAAPESGSYARLVAMADAALLVAKDV